MTMLDFIRELRRPRRRTRNGRRRIGVGFEGLESRTMLSGDTLSVAAVIHASDAKAACLDEVQCQLTRAASSLWSASATKPPVPNSPRLSYRSVRILAAASI